MSDLTIEYYWHCLTAEQFGPINTTGSDGSSYSTEWTKLDPREAEKQGSQYGWVCSCPSFRFRGVPCKHINRIRKRRCGWMQFESGGEAVEYVDPPARHCPKCMGPVACMGWGV